MTNTKKAKTAKKTLVLLDAHAIIHRAYHALPDFSSPKGEPTGALYGVVSMLLRIIETFGPDYIVACYDLPEPTYRHEAYKEYKAGREKADDALVAQLDRSRDVFEAFGIPIYDHPGFEADDMLGTIVEQVKGKKDIEVIIASGDMDTLQLVDKKRVQVFTLRKGIKDVVTYDQAAVEERFGFSPKSIPDFKGLRGDPSDNIPGIKGIGEKTGQILIEHFKTIEAMYKKLQKDEESLRSLGITPRIINLLKENEEEAVFSKMLATIRRDAPITFTLPKKTWRDGLDVETVLSLFSEFGFRTLGDRVRTLFGGAKEEEVVEDEEETVSVDEREVAEVGIALWLLHSDMTSPTYEDIMDYARSKGHGGSFDEARVYVFEELQASGMEDVYTDIELPLIDILKKMQEYGIKLDTTYLEKLSKKMHTELDQLSSSIYTHAGTEFNINSPKQLGEVLFETLGLEGKRAKLTATGQRSTKESELQKLKDQHPIITDILRYRELQKLLSTYIDNLPKMVDGNNRLHSTLLQAGTTTGRMASQNPNIQNIPTRTDEGYAIRKAFVAEEGYQLVAIDYSQIELRIAAILSGDPKLIDIFARGEDVHRGVAVRVFGVGADEVDADMRRRAKVINFGILYGMGVNALRQNLGEDTPRAEAQSFLNAYFNTFTTLAEYLEDTKAFAHKNGYTETLFGRRRYFEGIRSSVPFIRAQAERTAINAPIQGTQADLIKIAMREIDAYIEAEELQDDVRMLLQIHDELIFEIKKEKAKEMGALLKKIMEDALPQERQNGVPIIAEVAIGDNWGELEKQ